MEQIELVIPDGLAGSRVDKAVAELLDLSRARASTLVAGDVTLDGRPAAPSDRVAAGQVLRCSDPEEATALVPEDLEFDVILDDPSVIVVDKPAGLVVHPGSQHTTGTLAAGLAHRFPELVGIGAADRWGLVHRLDKDTSGALLVARTEAAFESLTGQLRRREVSRVYTALVEGRMAAHTGTIDAPIGRDPARPTRQKITPTGRHARTHYEVTTYYDETDLSLLSVRLETGRTHQIRVHLASIGHPVVGDWAYGATRRDQRPPRTFLHASRLDFDHPVTGDRLTVEAPLPGDLTALLDRLS